MKSKCIIFTLFLVKKDLFGQDETSRVSYVRVPGNLDSGGQLSERHFRLNVTLVDYRLVSDGISRKFAKKIEEE